MAQIKKDTSLRKAILQAAITGQLISSCHSELDSESAETGKQLLDRIIEERNKKLLAEWEEKQTDLFASNDARSKTAKTVRSEQIRLSQKIKKPAPVVASLQYDQDGRLLSEVEVPFVIPENWCWCRLGDVADKITDGTHKTPKYVSAGVKFISAKNVYDGKLDFGNCKYISDEEHKELFKRCNPEKNDLLLSKSGSIGTVVLNIYDFEFSLFESLALIKLNQNALSSIYFKYAIQYLCSFLTGNEIKGVAVKHLPIESIKNLLIPLPPLAVQNAIVAKLEQVLPLVDAYENAVLQKEELKNALPDKVKKAILQEAITGKLTENWRKTRPVVEPVETTETGKQLLDRIIADRNEKALAEWKESLKKNPKAKKPLAVVASEIEEDEIPFEVPDSWCWCHLGEICNEIKRGKSPKYVDRSDYLAFAQKCNVKTGGIDLSLALYLDEKSIDRYSETDNLIQGDVVINSTGGGTMGRVGLYETVVPDGIKGVYPDSHVTVIRSIGNVNQRYLYYILKHNQPVLEDCGTGSTNQTELKPGVLANLVIPLPPLEEQEEIVKKVEELLPLCK